MFLFGAIVSIFSCFLMISFLLYICYKKINKKFEFGEWEGVERIFNLPPTAIMNVIFLFKKDTREHPHPPTQPKNIIFDTIIVNQMCQTMLQISCIFLNLMVTTHDIWPILYGELKFCLIQITPCFNHLWPYGLDLVHSELSLIQSWIAWQS